MAALFLGDQLNTTKTSQNPSKSGPCRLGPHVLNSVWRDLLGGIRSPNSPLLLILDSRVFAEMPGRNSRFYFDWWIVEKRNLYALGFVLLLSGITAGAT